MADANGVFAPIYVDPALGYNLRVIAYDSNDVAISGWDIDNIPASDNVFSSGITVAGNSTITGTLDVTGGFANATTTIQASNPRLIFDETDANTDKRIWDFFVNGNILSLRTRTDADGTGEDILTVTRGAATAISSIAIGNTTDLPTISFNGANFPTTGTFTGTLTGMTAATTGTIYYEVRRGLCTLYIVANITGTSNTTAMTMTGLPAAVQPVTDIYAPCIVTDTGNATASMANVSGSTIYFTVPLVSGASVVSSSTNFTNSGTKGILTGWTMTYPLK